MVLKFLKKSLLLLLFIGLFTGEISAQAQKYEWKESEEAGYTYKYVTNDPLKARYYKLKNGLTVILSVNKKEPRIQTLIAVRAGSKNDPKFHTGLAHYLEHMLFKGTDKFGSLDWEKEKGYLSEIEDLYAKYNQTVDASLRKKIYHEIDSVSGIAAQYAIANEYDKMMGEMGAQKTNAHTSVEETVYQEDIPTGSLDKFIAVQAERFRNPILRLFHTELEAVYEEKNRTLDNDAVKVFHTMMESLFPNHNYGLQTTIGTIEHLKNPSLTAIKDFYHQYYVPNNMAIILAGDFNPEEVVAKIDKAFAYMQPKAVKEYEVAEEKPFDAPKIREVYGPNAENLVIAFRASGALNTKNLAKLNIISELLSNGKAGLMDVNLNQTQKVLSSGSYLYTFKDYSLVGLYGNAKEGQKIEEVKDLLLTELDKVKKGDFDETLLKAIVNNARFQEIEGLENNENRADMLMSAFIQHKGENWLNEVAFLDEMAKVSKKEIVDFANEAFKNDYVIVYKRKGEDKSIVKVEKPQITPVSINRDAKSKFLEDINTMPVSAVEPVFLDYQKDINFSKIGAADVLTIQNKENSLFRLHYKFDMGSWNDKLLPLAASYLRYIGTDKVSLEQFNKAFYNIACTYNINVGNDETLITITGLQENFAQAVSLLEDLLLNCKANEQSFKDFKARIVKSRENNKTNKSVILRGLMQYALFGEHNPFNHQLNTQELEDLKAQELISALHNIFKYKHSVNYYGPLETKSFTKEIKKYHKIPAKFVSYATPVKFEKLEQTGNQVLFTDYDMVQAEVYWVRNNELYNANKTTLLNVFNGYFGGGMGSIVFQTIRESKALAYSTFATISSPNNNKEKYSSLAYVGTQIDKLKDAVSGMNELLNELPEVNQLLENTKTALKQDIATERITKDDIIFNYYTAKKLGLNYDIRKQTYKELDNVTMLDVKNIHNNYLKSKPYTYCILGSETKINTEDIKTIGSFKKINLEQIFGY